MKLGLMGVFLGAVAGVAQASHPLPGLTGQNLYAQARQMAYLTEVFEERVDDRYHRSPVNRWADRLADRAEDFVDEIEDGDYREMLEEFRELSQAFALVNQAYGQCSLVPRDPVLVRLWAGISNLYRGIAYALQGGSIGRPQPYPRPYPVQPGRPHQPQPPRYRPPHRQPQQPFPYPNPRRDRRDPRFPW